MEVLFYYFYPYKIMKKGNTLSGYANDIYKE